MFFSHEGNRIAGTDFRFGFRDVLDILWPDIAAANDDQVLLAAGDVQIAVQQVAQIAGIHPAGHLNLLLRFIVAEIAVHQAGAGNRDMADLALRQRLPGFAADLDAVAGQRTAAVDEGRDGAGFCPARPLYPRTPKISRSTALVCGPEQGSEKLTARVFSARP